MCSENVSALDGIPGFVLGGLLDTILGAAFGAIIGPQSTRECILIFSRGGRGQLPGHNGYLTFKVDDSL